MDILLTDLENEVQNLLRAINEFIEEEDYEFAFLQAKALAQIRHKIFRLKNLQDPHHTNKVFLQNRIDRLYKSLSSNPAEYLSNYLLNEIQSAEKELEILQRRRSFELDNPPSTIIDQSIQDLLSGNIKRFSITFSKGDNITAHLKYNRRMLTVRIPGIKRLLKTWALSDYHIQRAQGLGFEQVKNGSELRLLLKGDRDEITNSLKIALARFTFEVLDTEKTSGESFVRIDP